MIAAVAVWLGLAMLGYGPRASASFLPFATEFPQASTAASSGGPADFDDAPEASPADLLGVMQACNCGPERQTEGGAGSGGSPTSPGPNGTVVVLVSPEGLTGPGLTARLRIRDSHLISDPHILAILDPPRAAC